MERFRYGTKEIIATLAGAALFVFAEWIEGYFIANGVVSPKLYEWVQLRVLVVAIVAAFFGPVSGLFCGVGGDLLINVMYESVISYPEVIVLGLYGLLVGYYYCRMHSDPAEFCAATFVDFNVVQIAVAIFCSMFTVPMLRFLFEGANLYHSVEIGAKSTVGNSVITGIICPVIMAIVSKVKKARKKDGVLGT